MLLAVGSILLATPVVAQPNLDCFSESTCKALVGKRVWVIHSALPVCPTQDMLKGCTNGRVGSRLIVTGVVHDAGGLPIWNYKVKTETGTTGFVSGANSHLLTFKDPRPGELARKQKALEEEAKRRAQQDADAKVIAAMPPEVYEKACIIAAGERLPHVPGTQVLASRALMLPPEKQAQIPPWHFYRIVEIDVKTVGQNVTYSFLCAKGLRTPPFIEALGYR